MAEREGEPVENFYGYLKLYRDGSVVRSAEEPLLPSSYPVSHKDIFLDGEKGLWARIYLPPQSTPNQRFPVIIYFHGGGFCFYSPATPIFHRLCLKWASDLGAVIVSINYRLAPEHRLPAAYDDSIAVLEWLHSNSTAQTDHLESRADYSKVFVAGESAGGNIAHHVGRWAADPANDTLRIKGMMLIYPFFGSEERKDSEKRGGGEQIFTSEMSDALWRLALPGGSNRDNPYCNPLMGCVEMELPPILFVIAGGDILRDVQLEYCEVLKKTGKHEVEMEVFEEEDHGFTISKMDHPNSAKVIQLISDFIEHKCCS